MSKSWTFILALAAMVPVPALAQETGTSAQASTQGTAQPSPADRAIAEKMMGAGGRITPDRSRNSCANPSRQGEIVVCAPSPDEFRIPSTGDSDPNSDQALNDGQLRAPDVAGGGIFKGKATFGGKCMIGPCPPEAAYMIDLSTIPLAPAGSDADKIAKGELRAP